MTLGILLASEYCCAKSLCCAFFIMSATEKMERDGYI